MNWRSVVQAFASVDSVSVGAGAAGAASSTFAAAIFGTTIEFERALEGVAAGF